MSLKLSPCLCLWRSRLTFPNKNHYQRPWEAVHWHSTMTARRVRLHPHGIKCLNGWLLLVTTLYQSPDLLGNFRMYSSCYFDMKRLRLKMPFRTGVRNTEDVEHKALTPPLNRAGAGAGAAVHPKQPQGLPSGTFFRSCGTRWNFVQTIRASLV